MSSSQLQTQCALLPQCDPRHRQIQCGFVFYMYHPGRGVGSKYTGSHDTIAYLWALGLTWMWFGIVASSSRACTRRWCAGLYPTASG
jgi:hypothetical protein